MSIQIITDTSCDLPDRELEQYGIEMIPLKVTFNNGETFLDRIELTADIFVHKMAASKTLPKTSTPDPQTFIDCFKKGLDQVGQVLFISLSSGLSGTYQTAKLAAKMLDHERVKIFDTFTASLGVGIFAIMASQMDKEGLSLDSIMTKLSARRAETETIFTLDTLDNVVKGGRLSRFEGFAGNLLNIKPVLRNDRATGTPVITEKVRSRRMAIKRLVDLLEELPGTPISQRLIGISHVNCEEAAQRLSQMITERYNPFKPIIIAPMSATIGTYAGEGGLMINC
ncbi:MAG: DegV family protein [Syntrophomonadaceae bacterium]|nr:DegV family protein [Syntrophomonadaceae bacterium]